MPSRISAVLLALTAALLVFDGVMHGILWGRSGANAIDRATHLLSGSRTALNATFGGELKVLWLADVVNLLAVAAICALAAFRPRLVSVPVLLILALLPGTLAGLLYWVGGPYYVANIQAIAAAGILIAALIRLTRPAPPAG